MTVRAVWLPPAGQTRADTRAAPTGTMTPAGPLTTAPGIVPGGNPLNLTGTAAMQAQLDVGRAVIQGTTAQGAYAVVVTAPEVLTFGPGHAQYDRFDLVVLRVYDTLYDSTGKSLAVVEIVPGQPIAAPQPPAAPACSLPLWQVKVPAGISAGTGGITWASAITDLRVFTVAAGGVRPDASTVPGAYVGQLRDTGARIERWSGTAWVAYPAALGGIAPSSLAAGSYVGQLRDSSYGPERWNGSGWMPFAPWTVYTPTWTGVTMGAATAHGRYCRIGKRVDVVADLVWGTGSAIPASSQVFVSLPFPAAASPGGVIGWQGVGKFAQPADYWHSLIAVVDPGQSKALLFGIADSNNAWVDISAGGSHYAWTQNGASMRMQVTYEAA
ncbi:hypothetical protein ACFYST_08135 [Kitasatospora sp. NPDC004614]|uniref:hypothetical protein n=1 Tax=unclassified Kitasatospora TaxID=2633591 RepID=UPI0036B941F0